MKKRKIKLLASLTSLVLVVAVMAVGVWAATSATFSVTSKATFEAKGVNARIVGNVVGAKNSVTEKTFTANSTDATSTDTWAIAENTFKDTNGGIATEDKTIYYTFAITNNNASGGFALECSLTVTTATTTNAVLKYSVNSELDAAKTAAAGAAGTPFAVVEAPGTEIIESLAATGTTYFVIALTITNVDLDASSDIAFGLNLQRAVSED